MAFPQKLEVFLDYFFLGEVECAGLAAIQGQLKDAADKLASGLDLLCNVPWDPVQWFRLCTARFECHESGQPLSYFELELVVFFVEESLGLVDYSFEQCGPYLNAPLSEHLLALLLESELDELFVPQTPHIHKLQLPDHFHQLQSLVP